MELSGIGQISIAVADIERAVSCYQDAFGLTFLFQTGNMAFFECGGVRIMLAEPELEAPEQGTSIIYFRVADIAGAIDELRSRGVEIIRQPQLTAEMPDHDLWMAFFADTEGNTLALMEERPRSG